MLFGYIVLSIAACIPIRNQDALTNATIITPEVVPTEINNINILIQESITPTVQSKIVTTQLNHLSVEPENQEFTVTETIIPTIAKLPTVSTNQDGIHLDKIDLDVEGNISDLKWSSDGRFLKMTISSYNKTGDFIIKTFQYSLIEGYIEANPASEILYSHDWEHLAIKSFAFKGSLSPDGQRVLFSRMSPDYSPDPDDIGSKPIEVWIAKKDRTEPVKLGGPYSNCQNLSNVIWFNRENKIIFVCGYDGPPSIFIANTDGSNTTYLDETVGISLDLGLSWMAISPDEKWLAFTDFFGSLKIINLESNEIKTIPFGFAPYWSFDSKRVFFIKNLNEMPSQIEGIFAYNIDSDNYYQILTSPVIGTDGKQLEIFPGEIAVSPVGNAIAFWSEGLWIASWN